MAVVKTELMLFNGLPIQNAVEKGQWIDIHPTNSTAGKGPIEFTYSGGIEYIDLNDTELYVLASIVKADGSPYSEPVDIAFVNNSLHSMFSDVFVKLGNETVEGGDSVYAYKAMLSTLFGYSESTIKTQLPSVGFIKDQGGKMESRENKGFIERKNWTNAGTREFQGKLFVDLFQHRQYLLNNVDLTIKLMRAKNEFAITNFVNGEKPRILIEDAILYVRKCVINPEIVLQHIDMLENEIMTNYFIDRYEIITYTIPSTTKSFRRDNIFLGKVPKSIMFAMVSNDGYNGNYLKNPFFFHHYNLNYMALFVNGDSIPFQPFTPDFANKKCLREYNSLYMCSGDLGRDMSLPFTYNDFMEGYTIFKFNLNPDLSNYGVDPSVGGNVRFDLKFSEALPESVSLIVMANFTAMINIDIARNVFCDYKA